MIAELNCDECRRKGEDIFRGCYEEGHLRYEDVDGNFVHRCPLALIKEQLWVIEIFNWQRRIDELGILPNAGGYLDQSATLIEAIETVRNNQPLPPRSYTP